MARGLTGALLAALQAQVVHPVFFYEGVFEAGTVRLWSGLGDITWDSQTWTGAGNLIGLTAIQETKTGQATGFSVRLNGALTALISLAIAQCRQGYAGTVWVGALDNTGAIIADPFKAFRGRLDVSDIVDEGEKCTITVTYESRIIDFERTRERRYTPEDQKIDYPTDTGFDQVAGLQDARVVWGPK